MTGRRGGGEGPGNDSRTDLVYPRRAFRRVAASRRELEAILSVLFFIRIRRNGDMPHVAMEFFGVEGIE